MAEIETYYRNLLHVCREMRALSPKAGADNSLSRAERGVLAAVCAAETEGTRVISAQIAAELGVTISAVSQAVDKLERLGYVRRASSDTDKKIAYVELTGEAKSRYEVYKKDRCRQLEKVLSRMGEESVAELLRLAERFASTVREVRRDTAERKR